MKRLVSALLLLILVVRTIAAYGPVSDLATARELNAWVHANVAYERSPDRIKPPAETLRDGAGDCADAAALLIAALEASGATQARMLLLDLDDYEAHHAVVSLYGHIFDPTTGRVFRERFPLPHRVADAVSIAGLLADWGGE